MREKEIKILWGRSGNRCAICKLELTPDGDKETLGEMAHIVARSNEGPRGDTSLTLEDRDKYNNLLLLCPTHHSNIDKNFNDWPVDRLHSIKAEHEAWVSEQLSTGNISVSKIDNTEFLQSRFAAWQELTRDHICIVLSLTPLRISGDQIDTMKQATRQSLERATIPGNNPIQQVNPYQTRPSEFGIVNEKFPELPNRYGHSYQIFKSGHCEYFQELGDGTDQITESIKEQGNDIKGARYVLRYTDIEEVIGAGVAWLELLWSNILPYEYLDFQCALLNSKNTTMFSREASWGDLVLGHPIRSAHLSYKEILPRNHVASSLELEVLKWVSNCYGLVLESKLTSSGDNRPTTMRRNI